MKRYNSLAFIGRNTNFHLVADATMSTKKTEKPLLVDPYSLPTLDSSMEEPIRRGVHGQLVDTSGEWAATLK